MLDNLQTLQWSAVSEVRQDLASPGHVELHARHAIFMGPQEPPVLPQCGAEPCGFEHTGVLRCPFHSSGTYETVDSNNCTDFMRVRLRPRP